MSPLLFSNDCEGPQAEEQIINISIKSKSEGWNVSEAEIKAWLDSHIAELVNKENRMPQLSVTVTREDHLSTSPVINYGERQLACVLLVDLSSSMVGQPIKELNDGLAAFGDALKSDSFAQGRLDVCVISFNDNVQTELDFCPASEYIAPKLRASGLSVMNKAIEAGLDAIEMRKTKYIDIGISWYRPWLLLLSDGSPTDTDIEERTKKRLQDAIRKRKVMFMPMGIGSNADNAKLQSYYPADAVGPVLKATFDNFKEAFVWVSASVVGVSDPDPDPNKKDEIRKDEIRVPPTPSCITIGI